MSVPASDIPRWEFPDKLQFLFEPHRYKIAHGGRGGAKSWGFARALLIKGWQEKLRILCAREVQNSIKDSVHRLLSDQTQIMGLGAHYQILTNEIRGANGTEIIFAGLQRQTTESIKSFEGIDIAWIEEGQRVSRRSLDILIPTIRKDGSEIWISFNPELDTDEVWTRFVEHPPLDSVIQEINYPDNPWFPEVLERERLEMLRQVELGVRDRADYDNIWEGKCKSAVDGAIYFKEVMDAKMNGRLKPVPYDPLLKVHTIWDLGWADSMSIILVQKAASEIRIIGYIEDSHRTYDSYVDELKALNYNWGNDWLPHDGRAKSAQTGKSPQEILKALGRNCNKENIAADVGLENGIKAARLMFPRVYFDEAKASLLFNRLGRYRRKINQATNQPGAPEHDENSHGADAFRMLAVVESRLSNDNNQSWGQPINYDSRGIV